MVNSYSDTVTEMVGNITRTTQTTTEEMSDHTKQLKTVVTDTSRQMVNGVLKDIYHHHQREGPDRHPADHGNGAGDGFHGHFHF